MLREPNDFDDFLNVTSRYGNFFVPENVYIIGTMNDIDRSVESMDFAMRRRFTFVELFAENLKVVLNLVHGIEVFFGGLGDIYLDRIHIMFGFG